MKKKIVTALIITVFTVQLCGCAVVDSIKEQLPEQISTSENIAETINKISDGAEQAHQILKDNGIDLASLVGVNEDATATDVLAALDNKLDELNSKMDTEDGAIDTVESIMKFLQNVNPDSPISDDMIRLIPDIMSGKELNQKEFVDAFFGEGVYAKIEAASSPELKELLDELNEKSKELKELQESENVDTDKINEVTKEVQDITARMKELLTVEEN